MGTCSSSQKKPDYLLKDPNREYLKTNGLSIPSPVKEKPLNAEGHIKLVGFKNRDSACSKEEMFFDLKAQLESDCEDEFLSVNGDFTPSHTNSPNHEPIYLMTPRRSLPPEDFLSFNPQTSSTGRKKLADLLFETLQSERTNNNEVQGEADQNQELKACVESGIIPVNCFSEHKVSPAASSACSCETPSREGRRAKIMPCCLSGLLQTLSFNEKRKLSP